MSKRVLAPAGFSLVEMITVMAIIMIMAAVMLPPLANYVRLYRIRAATNQVAGAISAARMRAISKNVQLGVTLAVIGNQSYQIVVEDDQDRQTAPNWQTIAAENWGTVLTMPAQAGAIETLPMGIEFDNPANCPGAPGPPTAADTWGLRFGRLGAGCGVTAAGCGGAPAGVPAYTPYVDVTGSLATLCVRQTNNNLRRWLNVSSGGRVTTQP
jgi:prepilin-type N-terminal cleavage/methylation domain-containing protein